MVSGGDSLLLLGYSRAPSCSISDAGLPRQLCEQDAILLEAREAHAIGGTIDVSTRNDRLLMLYEHGLDLIVDHRLAACLWLDGDPICLAIEWVCSLTGWHRDDALYLRHLLLLLNHGLGIHRLLLLKITDLVWLSKGLLVTMLYPLMPVLTLYE